MLTQQNKRLCDLIVEEEWKRMLECAEKELEKNSLNKIKENVMQVEIKVDTKLPEPLLKADSLEDNSIYEIVESPYGESNKTFGPGAIIYTLSNKHIYTSDGRSFPYNTWMASYLFKFIRKIQKITVE